MQFFTLKGLSMKNKYLENFEKNQIASKEVPSFRAGDTLRLSINIKEGEKTRVQKFEGVCISLRGSSVSKTFTIRKIGANGVGVERIFPIYSDSIVDIQVLRRGKVRRAKLYYLRDREGKAARIKELRSKK